MSAYRSFHTVSAKTKRLLKELETENEEQRIGKHPVTRVTATHEDDASTPTNPVLLRPVLLRKGRRAWTDEETQNLAQMYRDGRSAREMADRLGRSIESVQNKVCRLG